MRWLLGMAISSLLCGFVQATVFEYDGFDYSLGAWLHDESDWNHQLLHVRSPIISGDKAAPQTGRSVVSLQSETEMVLCSKLLSNPVDVRKQTVYVTALMHVINTMEQGSALIRHHPKNRRR